MAPTSQPTTRPTRPSHLTHDELDAVSRQRADCAAVGRTLRLERLARLADVTGPPGLGYDEHPREVAERDIRITEATAALADALHLHLD
jgi:hypothetical protein